MSFGTHRQDAKGGTPAGVGTRVANRFFGSSLRTLLLLSCP